jgi:uncharacterized Fe-S center protein
MAQSKVYFTDMHTTENENLLQKLKRLIYRAGIDDIDFEKKFAAIKIHFGEPGNLAYLRPNYARVVADAVRDLGGIPFLTDCNTLYVGGRKNAVEHLNSAYENGFSPLTTGCQIIIGDGLKGTDETLVPVEGGEYIKEAKIGHAIMDADIIISLSHFKVHEATGIGGALKNIGMGCGSRAGKMEMHYSGKPHVEQELCVGCGTCRKNCAQNAITIENKKASIDHDKCVGCGRCIGACPRDAVVPDDSNANDILDKRIAEYCCAVLRGRPSFHISLVTDVSPFCDCHSENDVPIVPNVGMFASFDPVALDVACARAVNGQPIVPGSLLDKCGGTHGADYFTTIHPTTDWMATIRHAEKLGLGSSSYDLIRI